MNLPKRGCQARREAVQQRELEEYIYVIDGEAVSLYCSCGAIFT